MIARRHKLLESFGISTDRFPEVVRDYRRVEGLTYHDFGNAVGVQPQTVYRWEAGKNLPWSKIIFQRLVDLKVIRHGLY